MRPDTTGAGPSLSAGSLRPSILRGSAAFLKAVWKGGLPPALAAKAAPAAALALFGLGVWAGSIAATPPEGGVATVAPPFAGRLRVDFSEPPTPPGAPPAPGPAHALGAGATVRQVAESEASPDERRPGAWPAAGKPLDDWRAGESHPEEEPQGLAEPEPRRAGEPRMGPVRFKDAPAAGGPAAVQAGRPISEPAPRLQAALPSALEPGRDREFALRRSMLADGFRTPVLKERPPQFATERAGETTAEGGVSAIKLDPNAAHHLDDGRGPHREKGATSFDAWPRGLREQFRGGGSGGASGGNSITQRE